jgi:hypothetical protein
VCNASKAVNWSQALTTIGAALEIVGLSVTGHALWVRGSRHNAPPGLLRRTYRRTENRIRAWLGWHKTQEIDLQAGELTLTPGHMWARALPGEIADDASLDDKVAWLRRYVENLDRDITSLIKEHGELADQLRSESRAATTALEQRLTDQDERFTQEAIADLGLAWAGVVLAAVGVALGLGGYWLT